jgi:hypothetical protein
LDSTSDSTSTTSDNTSDESGNNSEPEADQTDDCAEDGDTATESLTTTQGTKQHLDGVPEDTMIRPKIKKELNSSHLKVSDFDDISKEVLITAVSIFWCLLITHAPFPDTIAVEMKLTKEAWNKLCKIKGANIKLTPSAMKMVSHYVLCTFSV